ncbi:MAG: hypothetical protein WKF58_06320 [Ilumatobacteraceae bacterium]
MTVAVCGWVHGMVVLLQTNRSNVIEGVGQEFFFIIAAVLGGCLLTGGFGSVVGAGLGCLILGMTQQGIPLAGWDNNLYFLFLGIILLLAALANEWIRRWARTVVETDCRCARHRRRSPTPQRRGPPPMTEIGATTSSSCNGCRSTSATSSRCTRSRRACVPAR